jgi:hypothetical protein
MKVNREHPPHSQGAAHRRQRRFARRLILAVAAGTAVVAGSAASALAATATPQPPADRVVLEPTTGAHLAVSNEGNCSSISVEITVNGSSDDSVAVGYDIDGNCRVANVTGSLAPRDDISITDENYSNESTASVGASDSTASRYSSSQPSSGNSPMSVTATSCNWLHSSQTVQDVVFIDIAKSRLHSYRCWTGSQVRYEGTVTANSYTSVAWNHPYTPFFGSVDWNWVSTARATSIHDFHTDWVWCNATSNWQSIRLTNTNNSTASGGYSATFVQDRSCPGTHMATEAKANNSSTW